MASSGVVTASPLINGTGTPLLQGELVRISALNTLMRAQADSDAHLLGYIGVVFSGKCNPRGQVVVWNVGTPPKVLLEPGLTPLAGQTLWISATIAGRATNVEPPGPPGSPSIGTILDATNYTRDFSCVVVFASGGTGAQGPSRRSARRAGCHGRHRRDGRDGRERSGRRDGRERCAGRIRVRKDRQVPQELLARRVLRGLLVDRRGSKVRRVLPAGSKAFRAPSARKGFRERRALARKVRRARAVLPEQPEQRVLLVQLVPPAQQAPRAPPARAVRPARKEPPERTARAARRGSKVRVVCRAGSARRDFRARASRVHRAHQAVAKGFRVRRDRRAAVKGSRGQMDRTGPKDFRAPPV